MTIRKIIPILAALTAAPLFAAGVLTPTDSGLEPIQIRSHRVAVVINNGFAQTTVEQAFYNPSARDREAVYAVPVPESGALSELTIQAGETVMQGEVVRKEEAKTIYEEEKAAGNNAGLATKETYQRFEFKVSRIPAQAEVSMRYVYYEPIVLETGVGRYTYRLEEGGTDDAAASFWSSNDRVESEFVIDVDLKSAWPVSDVRSPGYAGAVSKSADDRWNLRYENASGGSLNQDFVFYYKLQDNLPGRLELLTYREGGDKPGTFMMLLTPGVDIQPLSQGSDYVFALDISGSMSGKLRTLAAGVKRALGQLRPEDRFRIVAFNDSAIEVTGGWKNATKEGVEQALWMIDSLASNGGTNVYAGVERSLKTLDADRVSTLILVTDGVTNQGIVDPAKFYKLLHGQDVRFFGFLLGNSSNWPLLRLMCEASGGYYRPVSNAGDIVGEIMLARNKIVHEAIHDAKVTIDGVDAFDVSDFRIGKIFYGQQLAFFGRYDKPGVAKVKLTARISGEDKVYETEADFPAAEQSHPELERLWALDQIEKIQIAEMAGFANAAEAKEAIADLGVAYQIVTDHTAMVALDDQAFARRGIERRNQARVAVEQAAAPARAQSSGAQRVDQQKPMYTKPARSLGGGGGGGGGAFEPWMAALVVLAGVASVWRRKRVRGVGMAVALGALALTGTGRLEASERVSVNDSIARFWELSESERRVATDVREPPAPEERTRNVVTVPAKADEHRVEQVDSRKKRTNRFGLKLLDSIRVFDIEWGDSREEETERYNGTVRR